MKSILFVGTEGLPYIKTGGLADVIGSLPKELNAKGYETRVIMPMYLKVANKYRDDMTFVTSYNVDSGDIHEVASVYTHTTGNTKYYFVEHQGFFERPEGLYGFDDDAARFAFFDKAVLELLKQIDYFPDVVHCHDWQTGMIPLMIKTHYEDDERYQAIKTVFTIHNLAFQGNFGTDVLWGCFGLPISYYNDGSLRFHNGISTLKAAVLFADKVTTVSDTYAHEILTSEFGEHMETVLQYRQSDLSGIVNGIDTDMWNPATDKLIAENYNEKTIKEGKIANKRALQKDLGLRVDDNVMVFGLVSRLTWQKGIYLLVEKMFDIMGQDIQLVVLGSGEANVENELRQIEYRFPRRAVYYCGYNEELSHRIYAGVDCFLMPSLFEPCGISQLISMRYGTLPLVRETGGLKDTVQPYNQYTKEGTGFSFEHFSADEMLNVLKYAIYVYYMERDNWDQLVQNAMALDVSWEASGMRYIELYETM